MPDEPNFPEALREHGGTLMVLGFVLGGLGALSIAAPLASGIAVALMVGVLVLFAAAAQLVFAFRAESLGGGLLRFVLGLLTLLAGVLMVAHPLLNLTFLTLVVAGYFLASSVAEVLFAFQVRPTEGWGWVLFGGIVSFFLGFLIWWEWPLSGAWAIGVLFGIKLLFSGFTLITFGAAARRLEAEAA